MTRKALGRGLSALLPDSYKDHAPVIPLKAGEQLLEIDIDLIEPNPQQPRARFTEEKLEELAQSIRVNGLVQPILVRRADAGRYQLVAGERRWRASQRAGLTKVKAVVRDIADDKLLELALIENIQRAELNAIEEAQAYQSLITRSALTQDEVAQQVGKDRSSVAYFLRLLKLPAAVQTMLEEEQLSMGHARALLGLASAESQFELAQRITANHLSVREVERIVKQFSAGETNSAKETVNSTPKEEDANIRAAETKLKRFLGTQVKIQVGKQRGKIEIEFTDMTELDRVYSLIMQKAKN
jgi:ParB family chromosome partitioning protein